MNSTLKYLLVSLGVLGFSVLAQAADGPDFPWDSGHENNPADGDAVNQGDDWMRYRAKSIRKRMSVEHQFGSGFFTNTGGYAVGSPSADTEDNGLHRIGSARCFISNSPPDQLGGAEFRTCTDNCVSDLDSTDEEFTAAGSLLNAAETGGVKCSATDNFGEDYAGAALCNGDDAVRRVGEGRCWIDVDGPDNSTGEIGGDTLDDYTLWVHNGTNWMTPGTTFTSTGLVTGDTQSQMVYEPGKTATVGVGDGVVIGTDQITFASAHGFINGDGPVTVTPASCDVEFGGVLLTDADTNDLWISRVNDTVITLHADKAKAVAGTPLLDLDDDTGEDNCVFTIDGKTVVRGGTFNDQHDSPSGTAGELYIKDSDGSLKHRKITLGVLGEESGVYHSEMESGDGAFFQHTFTALIQGNNGNIEHGLGSAPRILMAYITPVVGAGSDVCGMTSCGGLSNTGYDEGDYIPVAQVSRFGSYWASATEIGYAVNPYDADGILLAHKTTGLHIELQDATKWKLIIMAWK